MSPSADVIVECACMRCLSIPMSDKRASLMRRCMLAFVSLYIKLYVNLYVPPFRKIKTTSF